MSKWDQAELQRHIDDGVEESLTLDYKAAGALEKDDKNIVGEASANRLGAT